ncbi:hypothetical protein [Azotobacter salinestris]|uniref:hypothetical protein n=1 Tax=Azotobacter salinestris TaxID=69964 RepID=UPI001266BCD1|nr:hypothetical protein [Azotobacter salinestris]
MNPLLQGRMHADISLHAIALPFHSRPATPASSIQLDHDLVLADRPDGWRAVWIAVRAADGKIANK